MTREVTSQRKWSAPSLEHDRGDIVSTAPDEVDVDKNALGAFFITCDQRVTIDQTGVIDVYEMGEAAQGLGD